MIAARRPEGEEVKMNRNRRTLLVALVTLLALALQACAKPPAATPPPEPVPGERVPYVIGIPDLLEVLVWKNPELSKQVVVRSDGMISVPLLGDVQAEGLTPMELTEVLSQALSDYISAPDVTVMVVRSDSNSVAVVGAVGRSMVVPLTREMRVLDAIAMVGGFNTWARRNDVRILREAESGPAILYRFNYGAFLSGDDPDGNMLLEPGDTIIVPD
jgi:polysaccharide export outer membrane protein